MQLLYKLYRSKNRDYLSRLQHSEWVNILTDAFSEDIQVRMVAAFAPPTRTSQHICCIAQIALIADRLTQAYLVTHIDDVITMHKCELPDLIFKDQGRIAQLICVERSDGAEDRR